MTGGHVEDALRRVSNFEKDLVRMGWVQCGCGAWMLPDDGGGECTKCKAARIAGPAPE